METNLKITPSGAEIILLAAGRTALRKAVLSKPRDRAVVKTVITPVLIGGAPCLQAEVLHADNKATHKNIPTASESAANTLTELLAEYSQINIYTSLGDCEFRTTSKGKALALGADKLAKRLEDSDISLTAEPAVGNNRQKNYILSGSEPFLIRLGVSDKNGRVYDKKQAKFRQINRFLELVRDVEDKLPTDEIYICDLCCGKSYLSFAVYHYFANIKNYRVHMTGIDLKPDVMRFCSEAADALGFDGLHFVCGDINEFVIDYKPSLVISLHACDIATDIVLEKAAQWRADVILSTPCCHHELNRAISCEALSFITDYSMLRQKLCDAATDALRLKRLEAHGYEVAALELIDPEETPKNIMLRAVRKKTFDLRSKDAERARKEYLAAKAFLCGESDKQYHF